MMGDLGFSFDHAGAKWGGVVEVLDPALQAAIADVRTSGLNIMMSMKEEGKPISFVEDCAVPLMCLADYTARLTRGVREARHARHLVRARLGRLPACAPGAEPAPGEGREGDARHRRGSLRDGARLQGLAFRRARRRHRALGIPRVRCSASAWCKAFEEVKDRFDPKGLLNPGKIVRAPKFDDRSKFRYGPEYRAQEMKAVLDWSAYPGAGGGFQGAVEMCNNNGACRKSEGGVMCPSYRVTRDERDVTRGRANSLRLAITGQLGPDALTSDEMAETMKLCVSCKGCRRECPTGVDMARMKIEVQAARAAKHGLSLRDRLIGWMPRYAPYAAMMPWLFNARDRYPKLKEFSERFAGLSARRTLPQWRGDVFARLARLDGPAGGRARGRPARRHLQPLLRAREPRRRRDGAARRRLYGAHRQTRGWFEAPALLRPHLPRGRQGRRGAARGRARDRGGRAVRRRAACRWSGSSRAASSASATRCRR